MPSAVYGKPRIARIVTCFLVMSCLAGVLAFSRAAGAADDETGTVDPLSFTQSVSDTSGSAADTSSVPADSATTTIRFSQSMRDSLKARAEEEERNTVSVGPVTYSTDYRLNRATANWDQVLGFEFSARGVSVSTQTTGTVYSDTETKSNRRNSNSALSISYDASERLSVGLDISMSRHKDNFLRKQYDTDQAQARASYSWSESRNFSAKLTATAGSVDETKPTFTGSGTTSGLKLDGEYVFAFPCTLNVNASGQLSNKRSQDILTSYRTRDKDVNELVGTRLSFNPLRSTAMSVGLNKSSKRRQYPLSGRQETWDSRSSVADASMTLAVGRQTFLVSQAKYTDNDVVFDIDKVKSSTFLSKTLSTETQGLSLLGTAITSRFDLEYANSVMGSGRNGDINTRTLSGLVQRNVSPLISADVSGNISLAQYFFYDPGSIGDDRDIYKDALSFGIKIGGGNPRYSGTARVKRDIQKMIYVRALNSGNNRTNELYSASASFTYKRNSLIFTQTASATSDYTLFHYSAEQDILSRTTSISSAMDFPWGRRAAFRLSHTYRVQDSGLYKAPVGSSGRVYVRNGGSVTEELYLTNSYNVTSDFKITVSQRFQQTSTFRFVNGEKRWTTGGKVLEFLSDGGFKYTFSKTSSVQFSVSRTYSAFGRSYWNASAGFSREFF